MTVVAEQERARACSPEACMEMQRVLAPVGADGLRWAWCRRCLRAHCLGELLLDEWEPEDEVAWPCPHADSPAQVVAVDPMFWEDNPRVQRWLKRKGRT